MHTLMLISLICGAYICLRAVWPLPLRWWQRALLGVLVIAVALCFKALQVLGGGRLFAPDLPAWFIVGYAWLYLVLMTFGVGVLAVSVLQAGCLMVPAWRQLEKHTKRSCINKIHGVLLFISALLCGLGIWNALKLPEVRELQLNLPVRAPLRIAMLTDLHVDAVKKADFIRSIVERTNALKPDIVVITGDFVDGSVEKRGASLLPLRELQAPVYAVPGNHDYFSDYREWLPFMSSLGISMLNNDHVILPASHAVLAGVTDPAAALFDHERPHVEKALRGAPTDAPVILLAHQPKIALEASKCGVALQLTGHTHGGQLPGFVQLTAAFNHGWVSGLYRVGDMQLYISNGTSLWTGMPLRLGVPSEITLITITPAS